MASAAHFSFEIRQVLHISLLKYGKCCTFLVWNTASAVHFSFEIRQVLHISLLKYEAAWGQWGRVGTEPGSLPFIQLSVENPLGHSYTQGKVELHAALGVGLDLGVGEVGHCLCRSVQLVIAQQLVVSCTRDRYSLLPQYIYIYIYACTQKLKAL